MRCKNIHLAISVFVVFGIVSYFFLFNSISLLPEYIYPLLPTEGILFQSNSYKQDFSIRPINYTYKCCNSNTTNPYRKSIFYLKTHKCASSTMLNIIMRFGLRHNLNFVLPDKFLYYISYYEPYSEAARSSSLRTADGKYDILAHHIRYSPELKNLLPPDTVSVTMLRSPASLFESIYHFFEMDVKFRTPFRDFLNSPLDAKILDFDKNVYRGYNQMSVDLGYDKENFHNETAIKSFVRFIDEQFDFVMIADYIDESLVLFAHLMGWPLDHVMYLPLNSRTGPKYQMTESERDKLNELNHVDTVLYNHFLKKFYKCRQQYGIDRLQNQVKQLQRLNDALRQKCISANRNLIELDVNTYNVKNFFDKDCIYTTKYEMFFNNVLKARQKERLHPSPAPWFKLN